MVGRITYAKELLFNAAFIISSLFLFILKSVPTIRDELLPAEYRDIRMIEAFPNWSWQTYAVVWLGIVCLLIFELGYRKYASCQQGNKREIEPRQLQLTPLTGTPLLLQGTPATSTSVAQFNVTPSEPLTHFMLILRADGSAEIKEVSGG